jgi:hypothetical protein
MIAFYKLGFDESRYQSMKKAGLYLISCQKNGGDGYLLGGGKDRSGAYRKWRWASDNAYAYQALKAAEIWAVMKADFKFALWCAFASRKIIQGINNTLYINNPLDPDFGVWYRLMDENNKPVDPGYHDWINYAPQMLDLPVKGINRNRVGKWIHNNLQLSDSGCVWDNGQFKNRLSPGFSFQATLCWRDLGQSQYYIPALNWTLSSGLWKNNLDCDGVLGGWIDWLQPGSEPNRAQCYERFIDTSFYAIAAFNGGYDFNIVPNYLKIAYDNLKGLSAGTSCYLQFKFLAPESE